MVFIDPTNITTLHAFVNWSNDATGGWLGTLILISLLFVSFLTLKVGFSNQQSFASASALTAVAAILLSVIGIVPATTMYIFIVFAISGYIWISRQGREF